VDLRRARESDAAIAADLAQAESVLAGLAAERGRLEGQLRASEQALAATGALPDGPFAEEHGIQDVDCRIRVAQSRVKLIGGKLADSRANLNSLKGSLGGAFGQFVTTNLAEVRARYRAVALALRNIYCEQFPWLQAAQLAGVKVPPADVALIADPEHIGGERVLLDSRDIGLLAAAWKKFSGPLHVRLTALHAEVTAAIGETKAPREGVPAKAAPPLLYLRRHGTLAHPAGSVRQHVWNGCVARSGRRQGRFDLRPIAQLVRRRVFASQR
jgi:hypothetical protein